VQSNRRLNCKWANLRLSFFPSFVVWLCKLSDNVACANLQCGLCKPTMRLVHNLHFDLCKAAMQLVQILHCGLCKPTMQLVQNLHCGLCNTMQLVPNRHCGLCKTAMRNALRISTMLFVQVSTVRLCCSPLLGDEHVLSSSQANAIEPFDITLLSCDTLCATTNASPVQSFRVAIPRPHCDQNQNLNQNLSRNRNRNQSPNHNPNPNPNHNRRPTTLLVVGAHARACGCWCWQPPLRPCAEITAPEH
jgi:hypothetical protein